MPSCRQRTNDRGPKQKVTVKTKHGRHHNVTAFELGCTASPKQQPAPLCVRREKDGVLGNYERHTGSLWKHLSDVVRRTQALLTGTSLSVCCSFRRAVPTCRGTPGAPFGEPQVLAVPAVVGWASPLLPAEGVRVLPGSVSAQV